MKPNRLRFLLLIALTLLAAAAFADVQPPANVQICRFPAAGADPTRRWFTSQQLTCADAASAAPLERGAWNVFARSADAVSSAVFADRPALPSLDSLPLVPSAFVRAALPTDASGVIYVPRRATAYPLSERTVVPAGEELWLFVVSKKTPIGVLVIPPLEAGSERSVDARTGGSSFSLLGALQLPEEERAQVKTAKGVTAPTIRLSIGGKDLLPTSLPSTELLDGALVLFGGPAAGEGMVDVSGRGWIASRQRIKIESGRLNVLQSPIILQASATLVVNWSAASGLAELDALLGACDAVPPAPKFELTISSCAAPARGGVVDTKICQPIRQLQLPVERTSGSEAVESLRPGFYRAELRFGRLPVIASTAQVPPFRIVAIPVSAYYITAYGSVTYGGKPLGEDARLVFPTGVGFIARDRDQYRAVLTGPFDTDARIDVVPCRHDVFNLLADRPLFRNSRFDIEIPDNALSISVIDTFTRLPVDSAKLQFVVMSKSLLKRPVMTMERTAKAENAENGIATQFVMKSVPERELRLLVSTPGYEKKSIEPFSMTKSEKRSLEVQLMPLNGTRGKLVSSRPFERATIFWFGPGGTVSDQAEVEGDGSFFYNERVHIRNETMVVVSQSHPLWASSAPRFDRRAAIEIRFPDAAPVAEADITVPGNPARTITPIGISIGGLRVPARAFALHMTLRNSEPFVRAEGPLHVAGLAATGPIDVLRGATVAAIPSFTGGAGEFVPTATLRLEGRQVVFKPK